MTTTLTFLGAAGTVTGSKFLLEAQGRRVLVDAGLFQGEREWRRSNWRPLAVAPASIDAVVVTHAHLDHSGYLPVLAREGFSGPVICSRHTARLMEIVLRDAAHIQEEEARWARESGLSKHAEPRALYTTPDAEAALKLLDVLPGGERRDLGRGFSVELHRGGHILGSRFAVVGCQGSRVLFSGDLGRPDHPLLLPPEQPEPVDHVVVESTYGDRLHEGQAVEELAAALTRTLTRGGVALLPAFAIDRTPLLLRVVHDLVADGRVPDVPVYVDSPMAQAALAVYRDALADGDEQEFRPDLLTGGNPFDTGRLTLVPGPVESEQLNDPAHPCILISASGMATGGRVLHHLAHQLPHRRNCVVLTGYQVPGTRGRALADGAREIKIHGSYIPVRAEVANIRGFSAHADADELVDWLRNLPEPRTAFVVHGEPASAATLASRLRTELGWTAVVPRFEERVRVS
ncbi:MAG TPA: MBL fold metallo-hydrolase [Marmoricola sp.]|nr:MBL fold metallo-hydrolase [Marmoricola sp.]